MKLNSHFREIVKPRLTAMVLAFVTVVVFYVWLSNEMSQPRYVYLKNDYGFIANAVNYAILPNRLSIINLGGSTMREALIPRKKLTQMIYQATGEHFQVWDLASSSQTAAESLAIFSSLRLKRGSILIINIDAFRLSQGLAGAKAQFSTHRIPFLNYAPVGRFIKTEGADAPWEPKLLRNRLWIKEVYATYTKNADKLCLKVGSHSQHCLYMPTPDTWGKDVATSYQPYHYKMPMSYADKLVFIEKAIKYGLPDYKHNHKFSVGMLQTLIAKARAEGIQVVIMDLPRGPAGKLVHSKIAALYQSDVAHLIAVGAQYVNFIDDKQFNTDDFYNGLHFVPRGRKKFAALYVDMIKNIIKKENNYDT